MKKEKSGSQTKRPKQKAGSRWLLILLLAGGAFTLLICCTGAGVGGYFLFLSGPSIIGTWEQTGLNAAVLKQNWEFQRGGSGQTKMQFESAPGKVENRTGHFEYKLIPGDPLVLEAKLTRAEGDVNEGIKRDIGKTVRFKLVLQGETMRLTHLDPELRFEDTITLKRVR